MKIPHKETQAYERLKDIRKLGAVTIEAGLVAHRRLGGRPVDVRMWYERQIKLGNLVFAGGRYSLSPAVNDYFDSLGEIEEEEVPADRLPIVQPRQTNVFASPALSAKYIPSAIARRNDAGPAHDITRYSSGTSPERFRGGHL